MIGTASNNISQNGGHITVLESVADFSTISCKPPIPTKNIIHTTASERKIIVCNQKNYYQSVNKHMKMC